VARGEPEEKIFAGLKPGWRFIPPFFWNSIAIDTIWRENSPIDKPPIGYHVAGRFFIFTQTLFRCKISI
jgi:hypothetical protein